MLKDSIKKALEENNPLTKRRIEKMRMQIKNRDMTFLCPNCIGGILFHDLGLQFRSPTVNLMMTQTDFLQFVFHLDEALESKLEFYYSPSFTCPCAWLDLGDGGKVSIQFTHYHSEEEARDKWIERSKRVDKDNLFVFIEERDGLTKTDLESLSDIRAKGILAFTANRYDDIPYAVQIPKYEKDGEVGNILAKSYLDGSREYEKYFDFVRWFNEANGELDIRPFVRGIN